MVKRLIIIIFTAFLTIVNTNLSADALEAASTSAVKDLIVKHSMEMGLDPALALSIAKAESGFCHEKRSRYGAVGVFQLLPSTAKKMGYNPYKIHENIKGGIAYYKLMYKMFGSTELALAAYNAGPGNVKKYNGIPPFVETKKFVSSIMGNYKHLKVNPDPAIAKYKNSLKNVNNVREIVDVDDEELLAEEILQSYLEKQGI